VFYGIATFRVGTVWSSVESGVFEQVYGASEVHVCALSDRAFACAYGSLEVTRDDDAQHDANESASSNEILNVSVGVRVAVIEFAAIVCTGNVENLRESTVTF
jgi:hypothetical protein